MEVTPDRLTSNNVTQEDTQKQCTMLDEYIKTAQSANANLNTAHTFVSKQEVQALLQYIHRAHTPKEA